MNKPLDLTGCQFGSLTALTPARDKRGNTAWECRCVCGSVRIYTQGKLRDGTVKSCGCRNPARRREMAGLRFGRLLVLSESNRDPHGIIRWICRCDCGVEKPVRGDLLRKGIRKSCGCSRHARHQAP